MLSMRYFAGTLTGLAIAMATGSVSFAAPVTHVSHDGNQDPLSPSAGYLHVGNITPFPLLVNQFNSVTGPVNIDGEDAWQIIDPPPALSVRAVYQSPRVGFQTTLLAQSSWHAKFRMKGLPTNDEDTLGFLNGAFDVSMTTQIIGNIFLGDRYVISVFENGDGRQVVDANGNRTVLGRSFNTYELIYDPSQRVLNAGNIVDSGVDFYINGQLVDGNFLPISQSNFGNRVLIGDLVQDNGSGGAYYASSLFQYDPTATPFESTFIPTPATALSGLLLLGVNSIGRRRRH